MAIVGGYYDDDADGLQAAIPTLITMPLGSRYRI